MRYLTVLFVLCTLISLAVSALPPSFCKCTCFTNSTIVPLGPGHSSPPDDVSPPNLLLERTANGGSACSKCNRAFCLNQGIPSCKGAEEKDVFTTCFQRDSRKDQIIVLAFITVTLGLLGWAAVRKIMEKRTLRLNASEDRGQYASVDGR